MEETGSMSRFFCFHLLQVKAEFVIICKVFQYLFEEYDTYYFLHIIVKQCFESYFPCILLRQNSINNLLFTISR